MIMLMVILIMLWTTITMATKMKVTMTMDRSEIYCRFVLEYPKEVEEARAAEEACIQQLLPLIVSLSLSLILYADDHFKGLSGERRRDSGFNRSFPSDGTPLVHSSLLYFL